MPVDMFPSMNIPVVVVATFYAGMPPEQIEGDITYHLERFFTLASGIDHIESRSLTGVSIIRVYFQPDTNADIDAATIANLAVSDMKDLPPGTLAAGSAQIRRVQSAGLPGNDERRWHDRWQSEGHRAEFCAQPTWRAFTARPSRSRSAAHGGRSSFTWIRISWKPARSAPWTWCAR